MSAGQVFVVAQVTNLVANDLLNSRAKNSAAHALADTIAAHRARVVPEGTIGQGPDDSLITLAAPGQAEADALAERLRAMSAVQSVYVKPPDALP